jgi:hypothetical protein
MWPNALLQLQNAVHRDSLRVSGQQSKESAMSSSTESTGYPGTSPIRCTYGGQSAYQSQLSVRKIRSQFSERAGYSG